MVSYSVNYHQGEPAQAIIFAEKADGSRFVSCTKPDDQQGVQQLLQADPSGQTVKVVPGEQEHSLHFTLQSVA